MKKSFIDNLINSISIFSKDQHKNIHSDKVLSLINKSRNEEFPIYSLLIIISIETDKSESKELIKHDGWIDESVENLIIQLYTEIDRLKKIKLIDFPNIDKKWRIAFLATLSAAIIITISLVFRTTHYIEKTENLSQEKVKIVEKQDELKDKIGKYSDSTLFQEKKIDELNVDYSNANERIKVLNNNLSAKIYEIEQLKDQIYKLNQNYRKQKDRADKFDKENESLVFDNKFLKSKTKILEEKIRKINNVKFDIGINYSSANKCNGKYIEHSKLYFDTYHPVLIRNIKVIAKKDGYCEFYIKDSKTLEIRRKKVYLHKGLQRVNLNFTVSKGSNHYLGSYGVKLLTLKKCYQFPYLVANLIKLRKDNNDSFPSYFNWIVSANL